MSKDFFRQFKVDDDERIPLEQQVEIQEETDEPELEKEVEDQTEVVEETKEVTQEVEETDDEFSFSPFVESLADSDVLYVDPEKEYDDSEDGFRQVIEDTVEHKFNEKIKSLPEKFQRILDLGLKGGDLDEIIQHETKVDYTTVDVDDPDNQLLLITEHFEALGYKPETIQKKIDKIQDMGDQEEAAKEAHEFLVEKQKKDDLKFFKDQEDKISKSKKDADDLITNFRKEILATEEIGGFKVPKSEREKFADYITKPYKKVDGVWLTQQDFEAQSKKVQMEMSYYAFKGFNFKDVEKSVTTKKTLDLKKEVRRFTDTNAKNKSGSTVTQPKETIKIKSTFFNHSTQVED